MDAESIVEGRLRLMNHNLKFENYTESAYFESDHCMSYDKIHSQILEIINKEVSDDKSIICVITTKLPIVSDGAILTVYQFITYFFI